jgi:hypothetical protein
MSRHRQIIPYSGQQLRLVTHRSSICKLRAEILIQAQNQPQSAQNLHLRALQGENMCCLNPAWHQAVSTGR